MQVRLWQNDDLKVVEQMHQAMQLGYALPDLHEPLFALKRIVEDDHHAVAANAIKLIGESYLWLDPEVSDWKKVRAIQLLSHEQIKAAKELGLDEVSTWVSPQIEGRFKTFLEALGWRKSPWPSWSYLL